MTKLRSSILLDQWVNHWATAASVAVVATAVGFAIAYLEGDDMRAGAQAIAVPPQYQQALVDLDRAAVNKAYTEHVVRLFNVWVTDGYDATVHTPRGIKGINNGRDAYVRAMEAFEEREKQIRK
jgi:hypothetical protein